VAKPILARVLSRFYFLDHQLMSATSAIKIKPIISDKTDTTYSAVPLGTVNTKKIAAMVINMPSLKKSLRISGAI
jgi:hypothetical protein